MPPKPLSLVDRLRQPGAATAHCPLSDRDCAILDFLWRWKLATTATLHAATGCGRTGFATYQALIRLEGMKFIQCVREERSRFHYWELTKKGFQVTRESLGELKEHGFKSENAWHDLNVVAFHLGEWVHSPALQVEFFTEQQLRRRSRDDYPPWVPNTGEHRADGYTLIRSSSGREWKIAYEVELSAKSRDRYEAVIRYYRMHRGLDLVFWMIGSPEVRAQILKAKAQARDPRDNYHQFVDHAEYRKAGWRSRLTNAQGEEWRTIEERLREFLGDLPKTRQDIAHDGIASLVFYDPRKALRRQANPRHGDPAQV